MYVCQVVDGIVTGKRTASVYPSIAVGLRQDGHVRKHVALSSYGRAGQQSTPHARACASRPVPSLAGEPQLSPDSALHLAHSIRRELSHVVTQPLLRRRRDLIGHRFLLSTSEIH